VGFFVQVIRGNPLFSMYEIMGGMLWTLGFIGSFYCIKLIGLGVGMSTWYFILLFDFIDRFAEKYPSWRREGS